MFFCSHKDNLDQKRAQFRPKISLIIDWSFSWDQFNPTSEQSMGKMAATLQDNAASSWKSNDFPSKWTVDKGWFHRPWCLCFYHAGHTPLFLCLQCFFLLPIHRKVLVAKYRLYHKSSHLNGGMGWEARPEFFLQSPHKLKRLTLQTSITRTCCRLVAQTKMTY